MEHYVYLYWELPFKLCSVKLALSRVNSSLVYVPQTISFTGFQNIVDQFHYIQTINRLLRYSLCGVGGFLLLVGLIVLSCVDQDDARHSFGHSGGTNVPNFPYKNQPNVL